MSLMTRGLATVIGACARLITGAQARWIGCAPAATQRIYYANHRSHVDFVLIWASLPPPLRARTRPVAGADYWQKGRLKRFLITDVFHGVLIDRDPATRTADPIETTVQAMANGESVIIFPEGTRNMGDEPLLALKSGLYHLACRLPQVELVPVWIDNLGRVLPKGEVIPVPLLCTVNFGAPLAMRAGECKADFLARAREALLELAAHLRPA